MGFFFGGRKNHAASSSSSPNKAANKSKRISTKKRTDHGPPSPLLPLDDDEKPESTLTFDPSDTESSASEGSSSGGDDKLTRISDNDDESEILVDDLSRGTPKYSGGDNDSGFGGGLFVDNKKVVLTGKLPMNFVSVKGGNEDMSVVSGLSKNSTNSYNSSSNSSTNRQSFTQLRKEAPQQHLFKIPKAQPTKQKNNLLKYSQPKKAVTEMKGYFRYVAKGAEENDRSIYST